MTQAFVRFGPTHPKPNPAKPGEPWLSGSNLYIIAGGKLYPEILEPELGFLAGLQSVVSATLFALFPLRLLADVRSLPSLGDEVSPNGGSR